MTPLDFNYLSGLLKERSGLHLSPETNDLAEARLVPLARREGFDDINGLVTMLRTGDAQLIDSVAEAMTTNETFFFRDKTPFDHLRETIIPALLQSRASRRLRVCRQSRCTLTYS